MTTHGWVTLVACAGQLALFLLAVGRGARSPLAMPLALLSVALLSWNFASLAHEVSHQEPWLWLAGAASPITNALAMHVVLSFVGRRRSLAWLMYLHYAVFGVLSFVSLFTFVFPGLRALTGSPTWAIFHASLCAASMALAVVFLRLHKRHAVGAQEQIRTNLLLLALVAAALFAATELGANLGSDIVRLGNLGTLGANLLLTVVALRFRLLGRDLSTANAVYALNLAAMGVVAYLAVFRFFGTNVALLLVGTVSVTLTLLALSRRVLTARAVHRERMERLATLGRFSAQMAHDLKNPLAALKGAAQFLKEEHKQGRAMDPNGEFLDLMVDQIERLYRVVEHYQRLGRVEPVRQPLQLNDLVRSVLALQGFARSPTVEVRAELGNALPDCAVDRDLMAGALENLVRNAFEAMPRGGAVTVSTGLEHGEEDELFIAVEDTGEGMDVRTRERAFDDFHTTKATGSGMGLAFVRRVVEAHGGHVLLTSQEGRGTCVRMSFPARA